MAAKAQRVNQWVVSSDDPVILESAAGTEHVAALARPAALAGDKAPAVAYVQHALQCFQGFDTFCILQVTSPFTLASDVDGTLALMETTEARSAVSVVEVEHGVHPLKLKTMDGPVLRPLLEEEAGRIAAHEMPKVFVRNGSVYAGQARLADGGTLWDDTCVGYIMPRDRSHDINDELDWAFAEFLLERSLHHDRT